MKPFKGIRSSKWLTNLYVLIGVFFLVWMLFFDANSVLIQWQLRQEIKALEQEKRYLEKEVQSDSVLLKKFRDSLEKEPYAREGDHALHPIRLDERHAEATLQGAGGKGGCLLRIR